MAKSGAKKIKAAPLLPYEYYVDIVTKRYFHAVDTKQMDVILDCFNADGSLTEMTSNTHHKGREGVRKMFETLFSSFDRIWHGNFVITADPASESVCAQFSVEIQPAGTRTMLRYENCNRFYLKDRRFSDVYVYMSGDNLLR